LYDAQVRAFIVYFSSTFSAIIEFYSERLPLQYHPDAALNGMAVWTRIRI